MTNLKTKAISLAIVVLFAFAATIGATFAWFTIGQAAQVDDITLTVTSAESILILMDDDYNLVDDATTLNNPANYSSSLTNDDIEGVYLFNQIRLKPLTTTDGTTIKFRNGSTASAVPDADRALTGNYIEFSVWLLSQSVGAKLAIGEYQIAGTNTNTFKNRVTDTIRLSINDGTNTFMYGKDKDLGFTFQAGQEGYTGTAADSILTADKDDHEALYAEYYSSSGLDVTDERTIDKALATEITTLVANTPKKVTIRIWIEGWDADADNNLVAAAFEMNFQFIVKETI